MIRGMLKYTISILLIILGFKSIYGQSETGFNYQAVARNSQGQLLVNSSITVRFTIRSGSANGATVYVENHNNISTNEFGLFNLVIGEGSPVNGSFNNIDWAANNYFISASINGTDLGTDPLNSVPYSKVATRMQIENLQNVRNLLNPQNGQVLSWNGTEWVATTVSTQGSFNAGEGIDINNNVISNTQPDQVVSIAGGENINVTGNYPNFTISSTDEDTNPTNEYQTLSLNNLTLSISNGNSVILPPIIGGGSVWDQDGEIISYTAGNVGIGTTNPPLPLSVNGNGGYYLGNNLQIGMNVTNSNGGGIGVFGQNGNLNVTMTSQAGSNLLNNGNLGAVSVYDPGGNNRAFMTVSNQGYGFVVTRGPQGTANVQLDATSSDLDIGFVSVNNQNGQERSAVSVNTEDAGFLRLRGPSSENVIASSLQNFTDNGYVAVQDASNQNLAGMFVNATGQGVVFGDLKNFKMDHPDFPNREIWYASIEGPEAAAYVRGTSRLINGEANITFPDHFQIVANHENMTVMITPLSADSKGMAVVEKSETGFRVKELLEGTGNYEFDWEVKCVRKGFEDYQIIRDKEIMKPAKSPQKNIPN